MKVTYRGSYFGSRSLRPSSVSVMFSFQSQAATSTSSKPSLSSSSGDDSEKIVLILVGLIGSGKVYQSLHLLCLLQVVLNSHSRVHSPKLCKNISLPFADAAKMILVIGGWSSSSRGILFAKACPCASIAPISMKRELRPVIVNTN